MNYAQRFTILDNSEDGDTWTEELEFLQMNMYISAAKLNGLDAKPLSPYLALVEGEVFNRGELAELFGEP